jgi:hypothetical protein
MLCSRVLSRRNLSHLSRRCSPNSCLISRLEPLYLLFPTPVLCFQQLAASFPKSPGWGVLRFPFRPPTVHDPPLTTHSPLTTFRMNTCKSVSKQSTLTTFRMNTYVKQGEGGRGPLRFFSPLATRHCSSVVVAGVGESGDDVACATSVYATSVEVAYVPGGGVPVQTC